MSDERPALADYPWRRPFPTRWHDNDVFGHVNNTIYYAAMDTTVTSWLLGQAGYGMTEAQGDPAVVIASSCRYFASGAFPDTLVVGLRADRVGTTSVSWGLGIFRESDEELLATGTFVHVFVDRETRRPIPVPSPIRDRVVAELGADA
ncbi:acyl-CoA thioesterase [Amnibacterium sp.]|uniref:acyl-CoA thioesterase n=1 Tax=Amnibacterium sp. TaxID=1872496 RepID=UPI003F7BE410